MALLCGEISDDILRDCDQQPTGGVKSTLTLINVDDIESVEYDATNPLIVRSITLKTGKKAFKYEVYKRGHKPNWVSVNSEYGVNFRHAVVTSVQVWNNDVKNELMGLISGSVVAIAENLQGAGDARVEIYGLRQGLSVADGATRDLAANNGVVTLTLQSEDEALEATIPHSFAVNAAGGAYDYAATIAELETLYTVAA